VLQVNIVTCPEYPEKFIRCDVVAPFSLLSVVIAVSPAAGGVVALRR